MLSSNRRCSQKYRTSYKLFIQYVPWEDKAKAIKGKNYSIFILRIKQITY